MGPRNWRGRVAVDAGEAGRRLERLLCLFWRLEDAPQRLLSFAEGPRKGEGTYQRQMCGLGMAAHVHVANSESGETTGGASVAILTLGKVLQPFVRPLAPSRQRFGRVTPKTGLSGCKEITAQHAA